MDVQPCIVTTYRAITSTIVDRNYVLDTPGFSLGSYEFEQEPACGYSETVEVTGLPPDNLVIHDPVAGTLAM